MRTSSGIAFSADDKMLAVATDHGSEDDTAVRRLDVKDLTLRRQLKQQLRGSFPICLAIDPSNRHLAISCSDGRVRLWTAQAARTQMEVCSLPALKSETFLQ
jgi:WD40 repeat protein